MDESGRLHVDTEGEFDDLLDLKEALGLPDRLPPLRLPPEDELANAARCSELLERARRLAIWLHEHPRRRTVPAAALGLPEAPDPERRGDTWREVQAWELAEEVEFLVADGSRMVAGPGLDGWPDGADEEVLDVWEHALGHTLEETLSIAADLASDGLDFSGAGPAAFVALFVARDEGITVAELREMVKEVATAALPAATGERAWDSSTDESGDPVRALLAALAEHGAVDVDAETVRLTPLALYAMRLQLIEGGVEVPLLPPVEEMTAADVAAVGASGMTDELADEAAAWLARRSPEAAVDELLAVAATAGPAERMTATSIAAELASSGEARWREALHEPMLRPYAKITLAELGGADPENPAQFPPDLRPTLADLALLVTDTLAGMAGSLEPDELMEQLSRTVPAGEEERLFDQMWRLDHPNAHEVLMTVGAHHADKKVAKAARKAAYKIKPPAKR